MAYGTHWDVELRARRAAAALDGCITDESASLIAMARCGQPLFLLLFALDRVKALAPQKVGTFAASLVDQVRELGWSVVSIKDDWKRCFAFEK